MQYRGSFGSYVQSTWLLESDSGTTVDCWETSCTIVEDDEHKDKEEEDDDDEDDCWLEDLVLFLLFLPLRESAAEELAFWVKVVMSADEEE